MGNIAVAEVDIIQIHPDFPAAHIPSFESQVCKFPLHLASVDDTEILEVDVVHTLRNRFLVHKLEIED